MITTKKEERKKKGAVTRILRNFVGPNLVVFYIFRVQTREKKADQINFRSDQIWSDLDKIKIWLDLGI